MKNIFLIGFMGCGKSSAADFMEKSYGMKRIEMDQEIVQREGMSISRIFEIKGENYFRDRETELILELGRCSGTVISCGGGVVLREENVKAMKTGGKIVLLTASAETILERVKDDDSRPLLKDHKTAESIRQLMEQRRAKYESAADIIVHTDGRGIEDICKEILQKL